MAASHLWLEWKDERGRTRRAPLTRPLSIGRSSDNDVVLSSNLISRQHAMISPTPGGAMVDASNSSNGVRLGRSVSRRTFVSPMQPFVLGDVQFRVVAAEGVINSSPVRAAAVSRPVSGPRIGAAGIVAAAIGGSVMVAVAFVVVLLLVLPAGDSDEVVPGRVLASERIRADAGGTVRTENGVVVDIPPGGLDRDATLNIREVQPGTMDLPAGREFASGLFDIGVGDADVERPIEIRLPITGNPSDDIHAAFFDERSGSWWSLGGEVQGQELVFTTTHFTVFTVFGTSTAPTVLAFPFETGSDVGYSGGPHPYGSSPYASATVGRASGLDFAGLDVDGKGFPVLAVAGGKYLGRSEVKFEPDPVKGPPFTREVYGAGNWVLVQAPDGLQVGYWHLASFSPEILKLKVNDSIPQGYPIGIAGYSGRQLDKAGNPVVHLHLELSRGRTIASESGGTPVMWQGLAMNGWRFWMHRARAGGTNGPAYQGSATQGEHESKQISNTGICQSDPEVIAEVEKGFTGTCEIDTARTIFAGNGSPLKSQNVKNTTARTGPAPQPPDPATAKPGGVWVVKPLEVTGAIVDVVIEPRASAGRTLDYFNVTVFVNGAWVIACREDLPTSGAQYPCRIDLDALGVAPGSPFRVTFDVYDTTGTPNKSPHGIENSQRAADSATRPIPAPVGTPIPPTRTNTARPGQSVGPTTMTPTATRVPPSPTTRPTQTPVNTPTHTATARPPSPAPPRTATVAVPVHYSLSLMPDRTSYAIGEPIELCYYLSPENIPFRIVITKFTNSGSHDVVLDLSDNGAGGGDCIEATVGGPSGQRQYIGEAFVNGQFVAEDIAFVDIYGSPPIGPATPVATPTPAGSGACDRAPSSPANVRIIPGTNQLTWDITDSGGPGCRLEYEVNSFGGQNLWRGSSPVFALPDTSCSQHSFFIGARNQNFGFYYYTLWSELC